MGPILPGITRISAAMALVTIAALSAGAADRPAGVITPDGSPLFIDPFRATLFDTPALAVSVANRHSEPLSFTLHIWVFDSSNQLRGTMTWCTSTPVDRNMRGMFNIPLDIRGVTARDRGVVTVESAAGGRARWALRESLEDQLAAALSEARGSGGRLSMERLERDAREPFACPCECPQVEAGCERSCSRGIGAFTCNAFDLTGCAAGCTCK